jgi:phage shock protein E
MDWKKGERFEMKRFLAVLLALFSGACFSSQAEDAKPNEKPLADVKKEIQEGKAVIVDVREQTEWDAGHVKDAKLVPLSALKAGTSDLSALPKDKTIYTYCVRGVRAATAAAILKEKGYPATPLKEGFGDLSKNGFETTK